MLRMWDIRDVRLAASQSRLEWLPGHEAVFMANAWAVEATLIQLCLRLFRSGTSLYDTEVVAAGCPAATCIAEAQALHCWEWWQRRSRHQMLPTKILKYKYEMGCWGSLAASGKPALKTANLYGAS